MTAQPQFSQFGAPPSPPPGTTRVLGRLKTIATGGALVSVMAMGLQVILPEPYRPSDILGTAGGSAEKHEMLAKQDAKIAYERGVADATAQAQAKAQIDVAVVQKVLEQRAQALQGQSAMAMLADAACLGGQMVAGATSSTGVVGADWRRPNPETDWHRSAVAVASASCGLGDQVRNEIARSQLDSVYMAAAARGSPMTNGAVQPVAAPPLRLVTPQSAGPTPVQVPHRYLNADQKQELLSYAHDLPIELKRLFVEGIDTAHYGLTDEYYDRVAYYRENHPGG